MATTAASKPAPVDPVSPGRGVFAVPTISGFKAWWAANPVLASQLRGFAVVAVICTATSMSIFASLRPVTGTQWANVISLMLCSVLNTELNRRMSFGIKGRKLWWQDQRRGLGVMVLALAMTGGSLWILHLASPNASIVAELAVIVLGNVASAVTRFLLLRHWIFRRSRNGPPAQP